MAGLEDKINTSLDKVIASDWQGARPSSGKGTKKVKGRGRGKVKGAGRGVVQKKWSKGSGKGAGARQIQGAGKGNGKGKVKVRRLGAGGGLVRKTKFAKARRSSPVWEQPQQKGKGKGKGKRSWGTVQRGAKGKGKGKQRNQGGREWSENLSRQPRAGGFARRSNKGKGKGKGKARYQDEGRMQMRPRKGQGKGKGKSRNQQQQQEQYRTSDGFRVRREGGIMKQRRPIAKGKGSAKGGGRAFALATQGFKGGGGERSNQGWGRGAEAGNSRLSRDDEKIMKKITIVAQLDKVPKPSPAMQGLTMGSRSGGGRNERGGSLSRRFSSRGR